MTPCYDKAKKIHKLAICSYPILLFSPYNVKYVEEGTEMTLTDLGIQSVIAIAVQLFFISVSFYALQSIRLEVVFKKNRVFQAQLMLILLSLVLGTIAGNFFLQLMNWSSQLQYLF